MNIVQKTLIGFLYSIAVQIVSSPVMKELRDLVYAYADDDMTGEEKRAAVLKEMTELRGEVGALVRSLSSQLLNMALEIAVAFVRSKTGG